MADDHSKPDPSSGSESSGPDWQAFFHNMAEAMQVGQRALAQASTHALQTMTPPTEAAGHEDSSRSAGQSADPVNPDPMNLAPSFSAWAQALAKSPDSLYAAQSKLAQDYMALWAKTAEALHTPPDEAPKTGDRRFKDPSWQAFPMFSMLHQAYQLNCNFMDSLLEHAQDLDEAEQKKLRFFTRQMMDAASPANFFFTNPAALKAAMDTQGESLLRGMKQFEKDLAAGQGRLKISQVDKEKFKVGENVATAPGQVVFRNRLIEVIQYSPSTETVHEVPILIFPPWINKFYILDLQPKNSLIRWLVDQGFSVFLASWVNPTPELKDMGFEDYMREGVYAARDAVAKQTGVQKPHAVGYCIGGTLLGVSMAHMAAKGDPGFASATFFAAQHDFSEAGDLKLFVDENWLQEIERRMDAAGGVLSGQDMAETFNALRANDLIWSFYVNNYLLGQELPAFDLLYWNSDSTRMPKALHMFYLRQFYQNNATANGKLVLDDVKIDLSTIKTPIYIQAAKDDHIAPALSVYKGAKLFGGDVTYMMAGSGHIAGVINPPSSGKYQHWVNDKLPETLEAWKAEATEHPGSWWPHWQSWLAPRSGKQIPAHSPEDGPLEPLCPAPGTYVVAE